MQKMFCVTGLPKARFMPCCEVNHLYVFGIPALLEAESVQGIEPTAPSVCDVHLTVTPSP